MSAKGLPISKLIEAIRQASLHRLINALDDGCEIEEADQHGQGGLPLRTACFSGKLEIVRELIKRGANVNAAGADGPGMPLRLALRAGNIDIIRLLLEHGATPPEGMVLPEAAYAPPETPITAPPLEFEPAPKESSLTDFLPGNADSAPLPEPAPATPIENYQVDEEVDIQASYGLDTNLLNMDMLNFEEKEEKSASPTPEKSTPSTPEPTKGGFWKRSRDS